MSAFAPILTLLTVVEITPFGREIASLSWRNTRFAHENAKAQLSNLLVSF